MTDLHYVIVEHDGGWAYRLADVFSETFPTRRHAEEAAKRAAAEQTISGETAAIQYQDAAGVWHEELADGSDRPHTSVD